MKISQEILMNKVRLKGNRGNKGDNEVMCPLRKVFFSH